MANYQITSDRPGEPVMILVSSTDIASDSTLNALLPRAEVGTVAHTAGYGTMKQKGLDGSWTEI